MKLLYILISLITINLLGMDSKPVSLTSENTIVAFDLNDVLVEKDIKSMITKSCWVIANPWSWRYVFSPILWMKASQYSKETKAKEQIFMDKLMKDYPGLEYFKDNYISLSSSHTVIPESLDMVTQLKSAGFKVYIFSNMGPATMKEMIKKFPELFNQINGIFCPSEENGFDFKPNPSCYIAFKDYLKSKGDENKQIIFVDDRTENIQAAEEAGFIGIICNSIQNVRNRLVNLGLLSK